MPTRLRTRDRRGLRTRNPLRLTRLERQYGGQLKLVAQMVGSIVHGGYREDDPGSVTGIIETLQLYADALDGWARNTAARMIAEAAGADYKAWRERAAEMSTALSRELKNAPTGQVYARLMAEQVELIKSLPLDAAQRVHKLSAEGLQSGVRASELAKEIYRTGEVTESRAMLIARTETSRSASNFTQARAQYAGSIKYIWRTSGDSDVRHGHAEMNGEVCEWANPPLVNEGTEKKPNYMRHHPGTVWNCRCYAEPILPE